MKDNGKSKLIELIKERDELLVQLKYENSHIRNGRNRFKPVDKLVKKIGSANNFIYCEMEKLSYSHFNGRDVFVALAFLDREIQRKEESLLKINPDATHKIALNFDRPRTSRDERKYARKVEQQLQMLRSLRTKLNRLTDLD